MSGSFPEESLLELFIFETLQSLQQLEDSILASEQQDSLKVEDINLIFRIMHTIKGSAAVMGYTNISALAHAMEDLFFYLRDHPKAPYDCSELSDLILQGIDFTKLETIKIRNGDPADGDASALADELAAYLQYLKNRSASEAAERDADAAKLQHSAGMRQAADAGAAGTSCYRALLRFEETCQLENIRAFTVIHRLDETLDCTFTFQPEDIIENPDSADVIRRDGFVIVLETAVRREVIADFLRNAPYVSVMELEQLQERPSAIQHLTPLMQETEQPLHTNELAARMPDFTLQTAGGKKPKESGNFPPAHQTMISVNVAKMDKLMDLIGELVIAETMVTQNPDLAAVSGTLDNFSKAARQLRKISAEMQDVVMSLRMVPLAATFHKMGRIVRDMTRKLNKEATLVILGEETEVDKNIIEHLSDPLMHLVRNALDHGIEPPEERLTAGKPRSGTVTLEAKHSGGDVMVMIRDDGKGLHRDKIVRRALENGLLTRDERELSDKEIFKLIFHPGFSTKDSVSEFSGRGVGMDVVVKDLEQVGGTATVDSVPGAGSTVTLRIPLTLAIVDAMNVGVGDSRFSLPTASIVRSFRPNAKDLLLDPHGNEWIMVRGGCYPVLRLHHLSGTARSTASIEEGILIMVEDEGRSLCLLADELLGQQQVVVKALPDYIQNSAGSKHFAGCTLLGDGSISLILDVIRLTSAMNTAAISY
ncbi:chemotaxis protein CheA [Paenibacillus tianjinensis]|uniref:Chemotaxis protein CheA n=1 Tax=Paenibacillus tianjinensis TaxID=2810347 RepID=A0ABX7LJA5_9BACL|nr:chemotaxis protein CheA [Paenibacillus tianjinensis]QSF46963.1 chemotaxis protein CheA [Paenibacillus tianjinensis]